MAAPAAAPELRGADYRASIETCVRKALGTSEKYYSGHRLVFGDRLQHGFVDLGREVQPSWEAVVHESHYEDSRDCFEGREVCTPFFFLFFFFFF